MILSKKELRKTQYDFNSNTNRLLQADFSEYTSVLKKYIDFLRKTDVIYSYITDCGKPDVDPKPAVDQVISSHGEKLFITGDNDIEEIRNVFAVLAYLADNDIEIYYAATLSYTHGSKHFQDGIKAFNERFVMVLVRHLDRYLTKLGIEMGLDENVKYDVSVNNGIVNVASDGGTINATNTINNGIDQEELSSLIEAVKQSAAEIDQGEYEKINDSLELIKEELAKASPRKSGVKLALSVLKGIKGSTELMAAVATLVQFITSIFPQ